MAVSSPAYPEGGANRGKYRGRGVGQPGGLLLRQCRGGAGDQIHTGGGQCDVPPSLHSLALERQHPEKEADQETARDGSFLMGVMVKYLSTHTRTYTYTHTHTHTHK